MAVNGLIHSSPTEAAIIRRKVIIDTDVGIDDAHAIFLLLNDTSVDILAITCVGGNSALENVLVNTVKVLTVAGRLDIPIFKGCKAPLIGNVLPGDSFNYHGDDGLGDCDPADHQSIRTDDTIVQSEHATSAVIRLVKDNPGEISLICMAPLTNVAISLKIDPDFTKLLKSMYIMGGNHTGEGNITSAAEFNFHHDPEAASIVLTNAECDVTMVGWEICAAAENRFNSQWMTEFFNQPTPQGRFINKINEKIFTMIKQDILEDGTEVGVILCDEWVAAVFLDPTTCVRSKVWPTVVELAGKVTRGQCAVDKRISTGNKAQGKCNVRHVLELDVSRMKQRLIDMVKSSKFPYLIKP